MPKKNVAYTFRIGLVNQAARPSFKVNPTLTAGDFQISIDGGALANLATLPVVENASAVVKIALAQSEMNGDSIVIFCTDSDAQWDDVFIYIDTTLVTEDDLVRSVTPANALNVDATNAAKAQSVTVGTNNDKTGYALTAGEHTSIGADVWDTLRSSHTLANSFGAGVIVVTNNDKSGYSLTVAPPTAAAIATAVWTDTTAGDFATNGSPGKILVTQLGGAFTTVSSSVFTVAALANGPAGGGGGALPANGLDSVVIETGVNARQALSLILAVCCGQLSGNPGAVLSFAAGNVPATTRVVATLDSNNNRVGLALTIPP